MKKRYSIGLRFKLLFSSRLINFVKGKFFVFEGIDGAGLTTQAQLLESYLKKRGFSVLLTKEPTNGLIGGLIRAALKNEWKTSNQALQLLFSADRAHHLDVEILPALKKGKVVISDRYFFSTIAYGMLTLEKEWLKQLNSKFLLPDAVFVLDLPVEIALKRIASARLGYELFEERKKLEKVRKNFLLLAKEYKNCYVIDASKPIEEVNRKVVEIVEKLL